jgi:hypothetical protein
MHALLSCHFTLVVWREVKQAINLQLKRKDFISHRQWLFDFLAKATQLQATTLVVGF